MVALLSVFPESIFITIEKTIKFTLKILDPLLVITN